MSNENETWGWFVEVEYIYCKPTKKYKLDKFVPILKTIRENYKIKYISKYTYNPTNTYTINITDYNNYNHNYKQIYKNKYINFNIIFVVILILLFIFIISIKNDTSGILYYLT